MQYHVRAISDQHSVVRLTVEAHNEDDARKQIEARGLFAADISLASHRSLAGIFEKSDRKRLSLILFSQELLALLDAGLSIVEGLEALLEKETNEAARSVLDRLLTGLREGKRFSSVLSEHPKLFPPLFIGIVRAAEGTSDLPRSLSRFVDYQQRIDSVRNKVISASIYPLILLLVGGGVTFFLIGYVVPRFAEVYQGTGRSLPLASQLMLNWGQFASEHTAFLASSLMLAMGTSFWAVRRLLSDGAATVLNKIPGIADKARVYELSRLYLTLGMLLEGGIPIVAAMETVQGMISASIREGLQNAKDAVRSGVPVSNAFEANKLATPISLRMLRVGERSGELGKMLTQSAGFYDGEISRWIDRFTRTFEPVLMAAIGIIVGAIVVLLYMPILDLAGSLS